MDNIKAIIEDVFNFKDVDKEVIYYYDNFEKFTHISYQEILNELFIIEYSNKYNEVESYIQNIKNSIDNNKDKEFVNSINDIYSVLIITNKNDLNKKKTFLFSNNMNDISNDENSFYVFNNCNNELLKYTYLTSKNDDIKIRTNLFSLIVDESYYIIFDMTDILFKLLSLSIKKINSDYETNLDINYYNLSKTFKGININNDDEIILDLKLEYCKSSSFNTFEEYISWFISLINIDEDIKERISTIFYDENNNSDKKNCKCEYFLDLLDEFSKSLTTIEQMFDVIIVISYYLLEYLSETLTEEKNRLERLMNDKNNERNDNNE